MLESQRINRPLFLGTSLRVQRLELMMMIQTVEAESLSFLYEHITRLLVPIFMPLSGLLTASYFARRGYNVDVFERQPHPAVQGAQECGPDHPIVLSSRSERMYAACWRPVSEKLSAPET